MKPGTAPWTTRIVAATAVLCLSPALLPADEPPEQVTIRDRTMTVWPADDLRQRGFDVADIPRDENAAWTYIEAANAFAELPDDLKGAFGYACRTAWPPGSAGTKLEAWLTNKDNRRALELARQAGELERCQMPYFGDPGGSIIAVLLPSLSHHRHLAKMLIADGRRLEAGGKYARAFDNYITAWRMGAHIGQGITLIEALVGVACCAIGDQATRDLVLRRDLPPALLQKILDQTARLAETRPDMKRGVRMEKLFGLGIVDEFVSRPTMSLRNVHNFWNGDFDVNPPNETGWGVLEARIGRLMLPDRTIKRHMNTFYDELIRRSELPAYEANWPGDWEEQIVRSIPRWNVLARMLLPSLARANELGERLRTAAQMTRVIAALRLYAARHDGAFPDRLDELTDILGGADDLIDPFSGNQYVYQPEGEGWMLYSVGENMVDDGGKEDERAWKLDYVCRFPAPDVKPFEE
ncbi:MAG TPA: hypothetical protein VM243_05320 [Phycisphaerae bacterium]|nr:hypothetical protein [Phycisphaerae bacterium]